MKSEVAESAIEILKQLIAFPTVSAEDNRALIAFAAEYLEAAGARTTITLDPTSTKANLFATLGPEGNGGIVLSGHTDVVPAPDQEWTSDPFLLQERGDALYGRGTCDMKGFIAAVLAMVPYYAELDLARPLHIALTYDEETGCLGARQLVQELKRDGIEPALAIIGEPTEMRVIEGHKGCYEYTTYFQGTDGHGSDPDKGVNSIHYATKFIARLLEIGEDLKGRAGPDSARYSPPWTTVQVGQIHGGIARNVIARDCEVEWEMRPVRVKDGEDVKTALNEYCDTVLLPQMQAVYPDAKIETEVIGEVAGLEVMPENEAREIAVALTGNAETDVVSFGTEAGLFQALDMAVVVCGPGSIRQAHQPDEFLEIDQLEACLSMLTGLGASLTKPART
ncbi:MAG: acetylornithine deacetylase [Rhodobacteraceae bacterium]|nr:acetylornithine deacetylase [Paracoccaceae bacterium]